MGGCVSAVMDGRNSMSLTDHELIGKYRLYGQEAEPVAGTEKPGCSAVYRFVNTDEAENAKLTREYYYGPNWVQQIQQRCTDTPQRPAIGYRVLEKIEKRKVTDAQGREKVMEYYHCKPRTVFSYAELWSRIEAFGRGLTLLGLQPRSMVCIYEETRWEWIASIYGIWTQDMVASTVYANLGEDALLFALKETECKAIICKGQTAAQLAKVLQENSLKATIIYLDYLPAAVEAAGVTLVSWVSVVENGEKASSVPIHIPTNNDDHALVMYTSGTTGNPKGVIHTHGSICAGIRALSHRLDDLYQPGQEGEIYCAYLPLAHILEFAIVNIFLSRGTLVGIGSPRTLTDTFAIPHGDLREFKPKVIIAVPRIFDTIKKAVEAKLPAPGTFRRRIFDKAYESRRTALLDSKDTPYWNDKVFAMARKMLGGNVFGMLSGGGPLSASTQEFINTVCGGPLIIQGWGLTETIACATTQRIGDLEPYCTGQLLKTCEMVLVDTEEYKHTDQPEPRGEMLLRGPFMFKGYYKNEELTKEVLDEDGWFHTGDIGSVTKAGTIRVMGRIKALAKNILGEYIPLEVLEAIYSQDPISAVNGVCVLVHPEKSYIAALVLTDENRALALAAKHKISGTYQEILQNPAFHAAAATSMVLTAKASGRRSFELVKYVRVLDDVWTPENGLLTPTSKIRRSQVDKHYKGVIAELFSEQ